MQCNKRKEEFQGREEEPNLYNSHRRRRRCCCLSTQCTTSNDINTRDAFQQQLQHAKLRAYKADVKTFSLSLSLFCRAKVIKTNPAGVNLNGTLRGRKRGG